MARKKKKTLTLLLLVLVMIGMAGAYVALSKSNDAKDAAKEAEADGTSVSKIDTSKAVKITFSNEAGTMTLVNESNTWQNEADADFPVNQTYVTNMLSEMADIKATKTVAEKAKDLSQYGLDKPTVTAEIFLADKSSEKVTLGTVVPVAGGYYALIGDGTTVYTVATTIYDSFKYSEGQMIQMETTPTITTANITHLTVNAGKSGKSFEAAYDTEGTGASDYYLWDIKQPYATTVSGDPSQISTLLENYGSFTLEECVDYNCKNPEDYGISKDGKSVDIAYYEEQAADTSDTQATDDSTSSDTKTQKVGKSYSLLIGNVNENGDYYVQPSGSKAVYLMAADSVDTMMNINAFDYVNKNIFTDNIDDVTSIDLTVAGKTHTITATEVKSKSDSSTDSDTTNAATYTYTVDGKDMAAADFQTAYTNLVSVLYTGEIKDTVKDNTPTISITVHTATADRTVDFLPYDGTNFYRVSSDGDTYFLAEKPTVDDMVTSFLK